ncbi:family 6 glucosyltransferase [Anaerovibrio lipolyticus]|uniref:family 6 glucosyltransferase n=1 Tax=Anaerovibrio lipolyticus TaxID=82374 RepID=UPI0026F14F9E|nr:family 6 glucosyltransferase [Anaerovibrio lipolyticus]MBE6105753.1 glycosyl transferase family 6 [Anaerovibrio lipolyticus]
MKVAILYICTGRYEIFWKDFYLSAEKHFLPNADKYYYVFTDAEQIFYEDSESVKKIYQANLGWPGNTLFRFKMFAPYAKELESCDYVFFFNANALFLQDIGEEILPNNELLVVQHPIFYGKKREKFPYDRNPESLAYIPEDEGEVYVQGAFNGGSGKVYTKLILDLEKNIDIDYQKGIIALWHDESHLNKYILNHSYKILDPSYVFPEDCEKMPFDKKILMRDKKKYGGHGFLRQQSDDFIEQEKKENKLSRFINNMKKIFSK